MERNRGSPVMAVASAAAAVGEAEGGAGGEAAAGAAAPSRNISTGQLNNWFGN